MATLSEANPQTKVTLPDAKLFIDGELRDAEGGKPYDVISHNCSLAWRVPAKAQ